MRGTTKSFKNNKRIGRPYKHNCQTLKNGELESTADYFFSPWKEAAMKFGLFYQNSTFKCGLCGAVLLSVKSGVEYHLEKSCPYIKNKRKNEKRIIKIVKKYGKQVYECGEQLFECSACYSLVPIEKNAILSHLSECLEKKELIQMTQIMDQSDVSTNEDSLISHNVAVYTTIPTEEFENKSQDFDIFCSKLKSQPSYKELQQQLEKRNTLNDRKLKASLTENESLKTENQLLKNELIILKSTILDLFSSLGVLPHENEENK